MRARTNMPGRICGSAGTEASATSARDDGSISAPMREVDRGGDDVAGEVSATRLELDGGAEATLAAFDCELEVGAPVAAGHDGGGQARARRRAHSPSDTHFSLMTPSNGVRGQARRRRWPGPRRPTGEARRPGDGPTWDRIVHGAKGALAGSALQMGPDRQPVTVTVKVQSKVHPVRQQEEAQGGARVRRGGARAAPAGDGGSESARSAARGPGDGAPPGDMDEEERKRMFCIPVGLRAKGDLSDIGAHRINVVSASFAVKREGGAPCRTRTSCRSTRAFRGRRRTRTRRSCRRPRRRSGRRRRSLEGPGLLTTPDGLQRLSRASASLIAPRASRFGEALVVDPLGRHDARSSDPRSTAGFLTRLLLGK